MGFWDSFTGAQQAKDAKRANTAATSMLGDARTRALAALNGGQTTALGNLSTGYDTARGDITGGADRARTAIGTGYDTARGDLNTNFGRAEDAVTGYLNPFVQSGQNAQNLYDTALGTRGTAAERDSFYGEYANNDPFRAFRDEQANRQLDQQYNARGLGTSGRAGTAVARASLERGSTDLNQYLDRLARQGELGGQYASQAGSQLASIRTGLGSQLSGLEQNRGNALGGLEERTGNALGTLGYRYGSDQANVNQGNSQAAANLEYGYGQQLANNRIGLGNAQAASRSVLPNLLTNIAGTAIRAATPGYGGATPWSNLSSGMNNLTNRLGSSVGHYAIPGYPGS